MFAKMCHNFISFRLGHSPDFVHSIKNLSIRRYSKMNMCLAPNRRMVKTVLLLGIWEHEPENGCEPILGQKRSELDDM